jgi:hypothetical protein
MNQSWMPTRPNQTERDLPGEFDLLRELRELADDDRELASLVRLVRLLQDALVPIQPDDVFRTQLASTLWAASHARLGQQPSRWGRISRHWKLTAAAASGISVAVGVATVVAFARWRTNPSQAERPN